MQASFDLDITDLKRAFDALPRELDPRRMEACRVTSEEIVTEAKSRLERQLSSAATGKTVSQIHSQKAYDGQGYVILSDRGAGAGEPEQIANLPLWLEKGTRAGRRRNLASTAARPFFYPSIEMAIGGHERRVLEAMADAAEAAGLGD